MLRGILDYVLSLSDKGRPLHFIRPLVQANDVFLYEPPVNTQKAPYIRDAVDIKRWMILVVVALIPCILMAIWNTGMQDFVYSSGDYRLMREFLEASTSFDGYFSFAAKDNRYLTIMGIGLAAVLPIVLISYAVGGMWETLFACIRDHEISEGFLVTGMLYALILPPTIPYWMVAVGVSMGVVLGKELFGGSGMNIVNPAMTCRAFLFFTFPGRMTGDIWVGTDAAKIRESLFKMNKEAGTSSFDGFTQATPLARFNIPADIKKIHVDAIASNNLGTDVRSYSTIEKYFQTWNSNGQHDATLGQLSQDQLKDFLTSPTTDGGLGLSPGYFDEAYRFSSLNYGLGTDNDWGYFLGNKLGCLGETSGLAILIGAILMLYVGVASWRTMLAMGLGAFITALFFQYGAQFFGPDNGAWNPAIYGFPAYKHLLVGGLMFGIVFMATDPVTHPSTALGKWIFGLLCGLITILIRVINPAYPEGVMLAILIGNVFAPLIDYYSALRFRKRRTARVRSTASA